VTDSQDPDVDAALLRAKARYDASLPPQPRPVAVEPPALPRAALAPPAEVGLDVDEVRRARENLWLRIPKVHRVPPVELDRRVNDRRIAQAVNGWDFGSPCVLICGPTESGKSSAAAMMVIRLMVKGRESDWCKWRTIKWFGASELMSSAREWSLGSGDCPTVRAASNCQILVLDDLGNEQEWQTTMFDLLQRRYERCLTNIVTTGLRPADLVKRYGDAILRRLVQRDGKNGIIVNCWGDK
jgi:hypothetical protein